MARQQPESNPEVVEVLLALKTAIRVLGDTVRGVEKKLGYSFGYLTRVLNGTIELKVEHVIQIAGALKMDAAELFAFIYPVLKDPPSPAAVELWQRVGGNAPTGTFVIRNQYTAVVNKEDLDQVLRQSLSEILVDFASKLTPTPPTPKPGAE
jgi:transcriptional regulator with XRE-family HTH domain